MSGALNSFGEGRESPQQVTFQLIGGGKSRNYQCKERTTICRIRTVVLNRMTLPSREHLDIHGDVFDCHNLERVGCYLASSAQRPRMLLNIQGTGQLPPPTKNYSVSSDEIGLPWWLSEERICMQCRNRFNP